ncbi:hypothetical protein [Paenibacillus andongensis]|uniref:hypothetical protein n=1 Tax=Paenibacillus andongensis TaxID=2975482 RepID=UPI0021BABB81|nr:hypothetical protein [Paenibacillus andongensis]
MNTKVLCPLCNIEEKQVTEKVCDRCADLLEFGYPSFPAYTLQETGKSHVAKRKRVLILNNN